MAVSDSVAARMDGYADALAEIEPQIRGLEDKVNDALSTELKAVLNERLTYLKDRRTKINNAIATQTAANDAATVLDNEGFPTLPPLPIPAHLMAELDREGADDVAARSGFEAAQASTLAVSLGTPAEKP